MKPIDNTETLPDEFITDVRSTSLHLYMGTARINVI